jgi:TetR/AcrR family transcriptional regulator, transcriptional repressor for nem operon
VRTARLPQPSGGGVREAIRGIFVGPVDGITRDDSASCLIAGAAMERAHRDEQVSQQLRSTTRSLEFARCDVLTQAQEGGGIPATAAPPASPASSR